MIQGPIKHGKDSGADHCKPSGGSEKGYICGRISVTVIHRPKGRVNQHRQRNCRTRHVEPPFWCIELNESFNLVDASRITWLKLWRPVHLLTDCTLSFLFEIWSVNVSVGMGGGFTERVLF